MNKNKKYLPVFLISILFISSFFIWHFVLADKNTNSNYLKVVFIDVGQGDAIYIEAPNGKQFLIDSGPSSIILNKLSEYMPFADRSIDVFVVTNPDKDHIGGSLDILDRYEVGMIFESGTKKDTEIYRNLQDKIKRDEIKNYIAQSNQKIILDKEKDIYINILFPDRDVYDLENNDGSIVLRLVYGETSFMLMGDATKYTENLISWNVNDEDLKSDVLKLGHHGSKTSSSEFWIEKVSPKVAIISAGKNNRYNHPSKEVVDLLDNLDIKYLETSKEGSIIFKTDGVSLFQE